MFDFENWDLSPWEEWEGQISIADRVNGVKLVSTFCYSSESDNTEAVCLCLALLHDYLQQSILTFAEAAFEYHFDNFVRRDYRKTLLLNVLPWSAWEEENCWTGRDSRSDTRARHYAFTVVMSNY